MDVILIGGFHEIIELCEENHHEIVGIIDNNLKSEYFGFEVFGSDNEAVKLYPKLMKYPLVLTPDNPIVRKRLFGFYSSIGYKFCTIISETSKVSKSAQIGLGSIIQTSVNISTNVKVGSFVKLNTMSNIMHDCIIGDFSTIAPNAVLLGRVNISDNCYIGANSTILPEITVNQNVVVGAGSVVTKNINSNLIVKGIPAR